MSTENAVDPNKRRMLQGVLDAIRQPDPDAAAMQAVQDEALDAALDKLPDAEKRELAGQLLAVLAGAGLLLTLKPKEAHAELSMSEVRDAVRQALQSVLGPLIRVLMRAFTGNAGFGVPASVVQMIMLILEWLGSTSETIITGDPTEVLERSWPEDPPIPDAEKREIAMFMAEATRARAIQSGGMFGAAASSQAEATAAEAAIVATAAADPSLLTKVNATNALMASMCTRIGILTMNVAAHGQLTAHDTMRHSHEIESQQQLIERFVGAIEDLLAQGPSGSSFAGRQTRDDVYLG
jgi:hypothetical protein